MQSGLLERLREPMSEEWKVKISLTFPVWLTPGLWDLQACQLVTTVHSSAPVFYMSAVSFQCILYSCVLSLSLRCGIQSLEIEPFWFKIYRFTWVFSGKKENTHTLGNRNQTLNKEKQLLLSTFYILHAISRKEFISWCVWFMSLFYLVTCSTNCFAYFLRFQF